ncbi:MAG: hypothetical protein ABIO02_01565 [Patescibacteria group bacterium]
MDPSNQPKINSKVLFIVGGLLLMLIVVSGILTLNGSSKKKKTEVQQEKLTAEQEKIRRSLSLTPSPTYIPPANFSYYSPQGVNFYPSRINSFAVNQENVIKTGDQVYSDLSGIPLMNKVNEDIFTWLALNEYYLTADPSKVSETYNTNKIDNMANISKELNTMKADYNKDVMKIDGFFLRIRYGGVLPANLKQLKKTEDQLQPLANQMINSFQKQAQKDPKTVLDAFNKNNTVLLMNNREPSKKFDNYTGYPPLVADENYDALIKGLPVGQVSSIITLRSQQNGSPVANDYAYAVFYISKKVGTNLPIAALTNSYVAKSEIQ